MHDVSQALVVLRMFNDRERVSIEDVRVALDVEHERASRLLSVIAEHGFAFAVADAGPYQSTSPTSSVRDLERLRRIARSSLDQLSQASGETVHFGVLDGVGVRFVDTIESLAPLRVGGRVGRLLPVHATSMGKAMLATMSDKQLHALLPETRLARVVSHTHTSRDQLMREIREVRRSGFAVNREESEDGVGSVGVAIASESRGLLGAFSIATPIVRLTTDVVAEHAQMLREARERALEDLNLD